MTLKLRRLVLYFIQHEDIVASWGLTDIVIKENMMSFSVNGFKYHGEICITAQKAMYEINVGTERKIHITGVDEVVLALDNAIENGENYCSDVCKWLELKGL